MLVGPDGVGKTSVARVLCGQRSSAYFHFRPPVTSKMASAPPDGTIPPPPKASLTGSRLLGWVRLVRNLAWFWLAYLVRVRPALRKGHLVVGDRWAYGYLVQPYALKYYGPPWLARMALRWFPRPHLVANLSAPAGVIRQRKGELTGRQIEAELRAWRTLPVRALRTYEASGEPEAIAHSILEGLSR